MKRDESDSMYAARQAAKFRAAGDYHRAAAWDAICSQRVRPLRQKEADVADSVAGPADPLREDFRVS